VEGLDGGLPGTAEEVVARYDRLMDEVALSRARGGGGGRGARAPGGAPGPPGRGGGAGGPPPAAPRAGGPPPPAPPARAAGRGGAPPARAPAAALQLRACRDATRGRRQFVPHGVLPRIGTPLLR
jgi:hypothetical protein